MTNELIGKYVNFPHRQLTGKITNFFGGTVQVVMNWQELELWSQEYSRNKRVFNDYLWPIFDYHEFDQKEISELVSDTPKYMLEDVVLVRKESIIRSTPSQPIASQSASFSIPLRNRSGSSQEIEIMAKTVAFDSENTLLGVYDSKKEAKAQHKGDDVVFYDAKSFPEEGVGEYTAEELFPPKQKAAKAEAAEGDAPKRTRTVNRLEGAYTVAKADGARCPEGDDRNLFVEAMNANDTCEAFFEAVPAEVTYTSTKGEEAKTTAKAWFAYAVRRGWVKLGNADVVVEEE